VRIAARAAEATVHIASGLPFTSLRAKADLILRSAAFLPFTYLENVNRQTVSRSGNSSGS
jgi:hypothetical protein